MKRAVALVSCLALLWPVAALAHHSTTTTVIIKEYGGHGVEKRVVKEVVTVDSRSKGKKDRKNRHRSWEDEPVYGRVVSVEPVYRVVPYTERVNSCVSYVEQPRRYRSHTSTVLGAVIGAAVGHRIGDSHGDATAAAIAGGVLGASLGRDIGNHSWEGRNLVVNGPCRPAERQRTRRELVEYEVRYRYNGQVYSTRMDHDPGEWIALDVDVTPA